MEFGSLWSYLTAGGREGSNLSNERAKEADLSYQITRKLKRDALSKSRAYSGMTMSRAVARITRECLEHLPFGRFFDSKPILVPVPTHHRHGEEDLWVSERLADAMEKEGLGIKKMCLMRHAGIRSSKECLPEDRPTAEEHFQTMKVSEAIPDGRGFLLVDDVITRGATLMGAARRLGEAHRGCKIRAFAAVRAISNGAEFDRCWLSCRGAISDAGWGAKTDCFEHREFGWQGRA